MPCGSPSSRLPRSPMWPLETVNSDSDWAMSPRSNRVSRMRQGSTGKRCCSITGCPRSRSILLRVAQEFLQIGDDDVRAVLAQGVGLPDAVDPDDVAEFAVPTGFDARERVLEHRRLFRVHAEPFGPEQESVGRGFALQVLL